MGALCVGVYSIPSANGLVAGPEVTTGRSVFTIDRAAPVGTRLGCGDQGKGNCCLILVIDVVGELIFEIFDDRRNNLFKTLQDSLCQ